MPTQEYGSTQVKEIVVKRDEIISLVLDNIKARLGTPYDFNYDAPIVLACDDGSLVFRFVQSKVYNREGARAVRFMPMVVHGARAVVEQPPMPRGERGSREAVAPPEETAQETKA